MGSWKSAEEWEEVGEGLLGSKKEKRPKQKAQALGWELSDMNIL